MSKFRIHPSFGIARVGNSEEFFIGPEEPGVPANWDSASGRFLQFKDASKAVKRQAARFRIFEVTDDGRPLREVTVSDGTEIRWRVHMANRKASFFVFNGQSGASSPPYVERDSKPATEVEKPGRGLGRPERFNRRNASVADRRSLEIDPGEVLVPRTGRVRFEVANPSTPISYLGEAEQEGAGSLLVFGGKGASEKFPNAPPLDEYASNDGWFDDIGDGPVRAMVKLPNGQEVEAEAAWVVVGPPDYVPGIGNMVTLYDTLVDMVVRERLPVEEDPELDSVRALQRAWQAATNDFDGTIRPSFTRDIYPILARAFAAREVHQSYRQDMHATLLNWEKLGKDDDVQIRREIFKRVRDPNGPLDWKGMPRGLGDDFPSLDAFEEALEEEQDDPAEPSPRAFLSFTPVQYALLKKWAAGDFERDWTLGPNVTYAPVPARASAVTPHGLDRAGLESCVGGPFMPGIEVSWLIREKSLYARAFRLKPTGLTVGPLELKAGFFSQQMALPWAADFYDCHKEDHTPENETVDHVYMWWTTIRPDDVKEKPDGPFRRWVEPLDANRSEGVDDPDALENLQRFEQMRTRWHELSFVVLEGDAHITQK